MRSDIASDWVYTRADPDGEIAAALNSSDLGLAVFTARSGERAMLVRSEGGYYARPIALAQGLDLSVGRGKAAEQASLDAATVWGLPDFVMLPKKVAKGSAVREIGDGTVIVGNRGLAVQVKAREGNQGDEAREIRWLRKKATDAARQASGTIRSLRAETHSLVNARSRTIVCRGSEIDWIRVVILDHDQPPKIGVAPAVSDGDPPIIVILRGDWDFLFEHLRSVSAVTDYLFRVANQDPVDLGDEHVRYYRLAVADEEAPQDPPPKWAESLGADSFTRPLLPKAPANSADTIGHMMFRAILEDIATAQTDVSEEDRLEVLGLLDRFSIADRASLGRLMVSHLNDVALADPKDTMWKSRRIIQDGGLLQLGFTACNQLTQLHTEAFYQWVMLRHHDFTEGVKDQPSDAQRTVGVLVTPRSDGYRPWDTTVFVEFGPLGLTDVEIAGLREIWDSGDGGF